MINQCVARVGDYESQKMHFLFFFFESQIYDLRNNTVCPKLAPFFLFFSFFMAMCVMKQPITAPHRESSHHPTYRYLLVRYKMYNCTDRKLGIDIKGYILHTL